MKRRLLMVPALFGLGLLILPFGSLIPLGRTAPPQGSSVFSYRQVTVFGIEASPGGSTVSPQLRTVAQQLRRLLPGHSFQLLGAENERLLPGADLTCAAGPDRELSVRLLDPLDASSKVRFRVRLTSISSGKAIFDQVVATPPNQLVFLDKKLKDGRLLVGLGTR
jgi:hypothetical protein